MKVIGKPTNRLDGKALAKGKAVFADDIRIKNLLHIKLLYSTIPHGRITKINLDDAYSIPGVVAIMTHKDFRPHYYTTAGQGYPEPSPRDTMVLNPVVRFVGDKVAVIAAESVEAAELARDAIQVEYEKYPAI
ncbi:MAG: aldehyde oxidase, partial [Fidelibacterota bacterium]